MICDNLLFHPFTSMINMSTLQEKKSHLHHVIINKCHTYIANEAKIQMSVEWGFLFTASYFLNRKCGNVEWIPNPVLQTFLNSVHMV